MRYLMIRARHAFRLLPVTLFAGCFPTLHTPRIDPGFHVDAGATFIADQRRNDAPQGHDYMAYITPLYGFRGNWEIGLPIGIYLEQGLESLESNWQGRFGTDPRAIAVWPYIKVGLLNPKARDQVAFTLQSALILPANAGIAWSRDFGKVEPMISGTLIFSSGSAGDDPFVTRYQEDDQFLFAVHGGATLKTRSQPTLAVGLLHNRYNEDVVLGEGQVTRPRTFWDVYVGLRFRLF